MPASPPDGMQRIIPYLSYADAPQAIGFLCSASEWEGFGQSPLQLPGVHGQVYCFVDDVDAHFARAREAGATIVGEPKDEHGTRFYRAMDLEGHRWIFAAPLGAGR